nr:unnamed protein product [Callosobruchus analis]
MMSRENLARAIGEGRGKDKKSPHNSWMIGGIGLVLLLVPAALGALGVLATKALIVGKISLVLSLISTLQYFFSNGGKNVVPNVYGNKYAGAYGPPTSSGWNGYEAGPVYGRSFQDRDEYSKHESSRDQLKQ